MASQLSNEELKRLARLGAAARLQQIEDERKTILRAFPGLGATKVTLVADGRAVEADTTGAPKKKARKRRKMTAAEKKAASDRMIKYWADKKKA